MTEPVDIRAYNRHAWNAQVRYGNPWTVPAGSKEVARARAGDWSIVLTPTQPVPQAWFPRTLAGVEILCLASGGGQQGPILAAAGARVTVFDNAPAQLAQDRAVAERDGLEITTVEGDMRDLSAFADHSFELIVHPVSNVFVPDVLPVWRESHRVLQPAGILLAGMTDPVRYCFEERSLTRGALTVTQRLPYADVDDPAIVDRRRADEDPLEFSHTRAELIGGQCEAGFAITGYYEDRYASGDPLSDFLPTFFATRAVKSA